MDGRDCFRRARLPVGNSELGPPIDMASAPPQQDLFSERILDMPAHDHHDRAHQGETLLISRSELAALVGLNSILTHQEANIGGSQRGPSSRALQVATFKDSSSHEFTMCSLSPARAAPVGYQSSVAPFLDPPSRGNPLYRQLLTLKLLREDLEELTDISTETHTLIAQICNYSGELFDQPKDQHEWQSRLRFRIAEDHISQELKLACEWVRLFELRPEYVPLAPPNIVREFYDIQQIKHKSKTAVTQPSLTALIKKRVEDDKKLWNTVITDRNIRCGWPLETDIATLDDSEPSRETASLVSLSASTMTSAAVISKKRKRQTADGDRSSSDRDLPRPQKRSSHTGHTSITLQVNPLSQAHTQQALVPAAYLVQPTAPAACRVPRWPYQLPVGQRRGLRPGNGTSTFPYEWSQGRKRAWLEIKPANGSLPSEAIVNHWNYFTSCCTSGNADIGLLGNAHVSIVEFLSYFPQHIKWRAIAKRLRDAG